MSDSDASEKTEEPTQRKLDKAKNQGQVAKSRELGHTLIILAVTLLLLFWISTFVSNIYMVLKDFLINAHQISMAPVDLGNYLQSALGELALVLVPLMLLFLLVGIMSNVFQTGFFIATEALKLRWQSFSLIAGVKRMFSITQVIELVKAVIKIMVFGTLAGFLVVNVLEGMDEIPGIAIIDSLEYLITLMVILLITYVFIMAIVSVVDIAFQRFQHTKRNRMSKQEVKDEFKQIDGDPQVKARIRRLRMERSQARAMSDVPNADVVVVNPTHFAVALSYDPDADDRPYVVAKGQDEWAMRIRTIAESNDVPVVRDPPLARTLYVTLEVGDHILEEQFAAVAEVIKYVFELKGRDLSDAA